MGWASGSGLMSDVVLAFKNAFRDVDIPDDAVVDFWRCAIEAFESEDWDTQGEVVGQDSLWDKAYFDSHPYDAGYHAKIEDENPYEANTAAWLAWQAGREEALGKGCTYYEA